MGEIAEMMLDGTLCQVCGEFMGDGCGFPRTCRGCQKDTKEAHPDRTNCPLCNKRVKLAGLEMHKRDVHGKRLGLKS